MFESIYLYYVDLRAFMANVTEGYFLDYSLETILLNVEGKKLLIEIYYLYGSLLMLLDRLIPSLARERMVVCYMRYKGYN